MADNKAVPTGNRITDLDFRRGDKGEGRLLIKLADDKADINVFVEGPRIKNRFLPMLRCPKAFSASLMWRILQPR